MRMRNLLLGLGFVLQIQAAGRAEAGDHHQESRCGWRLKSLASSLEMYRNDHGQYPHELQLLKGALAPFHCAGGSQPFRYRVEVGGKGYSLVCVSNKHRLKGFPRYSNKRGLQWK